LVEGQRKGWIGGVLSFCASGAGVLTEASAGTRVTSSRALS
jgi:hypothetical protein